MAHAHTIFTTMEFLFWFCQILSVSAQESSVPADRSLSVMDVVTSKFMFLWSLRALTADAIQGARTSITGILLGLVAVFVVRYVRSPWRKLPPGPRGLPLIGNALKLMDMNWWFSVDCKDRFGELMYLNVAGQPVVVLNSLKSSYDLLERRAISYSDRPRYIMVQEIMSKDLLLSVMRFGDRFRRMRRAAHEALTKRAVQNYHPIQTKEAVILASSLISSSAGVDLPKQFYRTGASTIISIVYDYPTLESMNDPGVKNIEDYTLRLSIALRPGRYLVDIFPWMMYIPERFAKWKQEGLKQFTEDYAMFKSLLDRVRVDLANGGTRPSFSATLLQDPKHNNLSEAEMSYLAGILYAGGGESTTITYIGRDRLPNFADAPRLPYVCAIVREVLRWRPILPLGLPHAAIKDDWYEGMFIPKGTVCVPNIWHCNHDREVFGEGANEFRPERHLNKRGELVLGPVQTNHAGHVSFGFGRRLCPGKDLVNDALFIDTSCMLWAAKFERAQDKNGKEMPLDLDMHVDAKLVTVPVPYDCVITPRFPEAESILAEERERF